MSSGKSTLPQLRAKDSGGSFQPGSASANPATFICQHISLLSLFHCPSLSCSTAWQLLQDCLSAAASVPVGRELWAWQLLPREVHTSPAKGQTPVPAGWGWFHPWLRAQEELRSSPSKLELICSWVKWERAVAPADGAVWCRGTARHPSEVPQRNSLSFGLKTPSPPLPL